MRRRPLIGVTMGTGGRPGAYSLPMGYAKSIELAGGLAWPIPYGMDLGLAREVVDLLDGLVLSGGDDLDPAAWGEAWHAKVVRIEPARQAYEMALLGEAERRGLPVLGVCLGVQVMNVYRGGSLIQFLPEFEREGALEHRKVGDGENWHEVRVEADSVLGGVVGRPELEVNTQHKQAIGRLGRGLRVVARAPDGIIEAVEDGSMPLFLGVQWHPERLADREEHLGLFRLVVERGGQKARRQGGSRSAGSGQAPARRKAAGVESIVEER